MREGVLILLERKYEDGIFPSRVLSGVQPANRLHLGHYFGAIKQHIELQHEYPGESFYFIANYHALTTIHDKELLRRQSWNVTLDYLALGLDPTKATFYRQSDIPHVCELMWILSCITGKNLLDRAPLYREKTENGFQPSVGLFLYPELMAADILALRATIVPAGKDQEQHLEMTRNIVKSFNTTFGVQMFPQPSILVSEAGTVPGIDGQKMSKTYDNIIPIFAEYDELAARVTHIKTSSVLSGSPLDPHSDTIFALYRLVSTSEEQTDMLHRYLSGSIDYQQAKIELLAKLSEFFASFKVKRQELERDLDTVEDILRDGARRAREEVKDTLELVRDCIGLGRYQRVIASKVVNRR